MKKSTFIIFVTYIWAKTLLGLTIRPIVTARQVARRPILLPVVFTPFIGLFMLFIFGRIGAYLIDVYELKRELIAMILGTALISITLWQALLVYLLVSLIIAYRRS
jgi:hypothetical protein